MMRSANHAALSDEVAKFQAEVRRLAFDAVRAVLRQELDRKLAKARPAPRRRAKRPGRSSTTTVPATTTRDQPPDQPAATPAVEPREQPEHPPTGKRKRVAWTREAIVDELATWMSSGTAIDAMFLKRHGPPGLVAATRRIFGRFEAALNVAALQVSKLNPDGPPTP